MLINGYMHRPHRRGDGPLGVHFTAVKQHRPHRRGDGPDGFKVRDHCPPIVPTGVGMDRRRSARCGRRWHRPHRRGDGPSSNRMRPAGTLSSPQAWGWTEPSHGHHGVPGIVPTGVGMDRPWPSRAWPRPDRPHRRSGDGPLTWYGAAGAVASSPQAGMDRPSLPLGAPDPASSPQAWGWTDSLKVVVSSCVIVPTGVGMDRGGRRGGGHGAESSPQAWGWTGGAGVVRGVHDIVPTGVGMDRCSAW